MYFLYKYNPVFWQNLFPLLTKCLLLKVHICSYALQWTPPKVYRPVLESDLLLRRNKTRQNKPETASTRDATLENGAWKHGSFFFLERPSYKYVRATGFWSGILSANFEFSVETILSYFQLEAHFCSHVYCQMLSRVVRVFKPEFRVSWTVETIPSYFQLEAHFAPTFSAKCYQGWQTRHFDKLWWSHRLNISPDLFLGHHWKKNKVASHCPRNAVTLLVQASLNLLGIQSNCNCGVNFIVLFCNNRKLTYFIFRMPNAPTPTHPVKLLLFFLI